MSAFGPIQTIDAHTGGEPLRIVTKGLPPIVGDTILDKRTYAERELDGLRRALMLEPRGHADMYGAFLTEPTTPDGHVGVLFLHNAGFSTMCGHGIIALGKVGIERGLFRADDDGVIRFDTPAGRVVASVRRDGDRVVEVSFRNVASFVQHADAAVEIAGIGRVRYDLAYGGAFYAYVEATDLGVAVRPENQDRLVELSRAIKPVVQAHTPPVYPGGDERLGFVYGVIFSEPGQGGVHTRNVCVFADGEVDRSPTGTGVSGRAAILHARGELALGEDIEIASIIGSSFRVRVAETTTVGPHAAIVPEVAGTAFITGEHTFVFDPSDPLRDGVLLR
ncbi:MAG: proline racemase [Myxococcales bacterium FL481]|nr:MAG: proline racemase [Myxococcales bacterium FL481]